MKIKARNTIIFQMWPFRKCQGFAMETKEEDPDTDTGQEPDGNLKDLL